MIELEDFHEDILGKSMRGLSIGKNEMAERLSVQKSDIERILQGGSDLKLIQSMACQLNLDATKLLVAVTKQWVPAPLNINGLKQFNYPFGSMLVNAFVTWCDETKKAWIFDAGPMAVLITDFLGRIR